MNCQSQQYHHHHPMYTTTTADSSNHHNNNQNKVGSPPMGYKSHKRKFFETFMRENEDEEEYLPIQQNKRFLSEEMALQLHKMNISDHQSNQLLQQQQQQQFDHDFTTNHMNSNPAVQTTTTNSITDDHNSVERDPLIHDPKQQLSSFHENKKIIIPPIIADQLRLNASVIQPAYYVRAVVPYKDHISESLSRKSTVTSPTNMLPSTNAIPTTPSQIPTIVITDHHHLNTNNSNNNDNSSNMMTDD